VWSTVRAPPTVGSAAQISNQHAPEPGRYHTPPAPASRRWHGSSALSGQPRQAEKGETVRLPVWLFIGEPEAHAAPLRGRALLYLRPGPSAPVRLLFPETHAYAIPERPPRRARNGSQRTRPRAADGVTQTEIITAAAAGIDTAASGTPTSHGDKAASRAQVRAKRQPQKLEARS